MSTATLRPNAAGDVTQLDKTGVDYNWQAVDDVSPDETTTQVYNHGSKYSATEGYDLYNLPAYGGGEPINFIKVYARCSRLYNATALIKIKTNGVEYEGTEFTPSANDFSNYSKQWNTNPNTGSAWTKAQIDALQVGIRLKCPEGDANYGRCTQVYVEVDYTLVTAPTVTTQDATGIGLDSPSAHATLHGNIPDIGGENCNQRGFDWDYNSGAPYTYSWAETDSYGTGAFSHQITGLTEGVTVYFRAKAHNSAGWGYGSEKSFVTPKAWSKTLTEPLGLLDTYGRTWAIYRVYPEILGLSDTVVKTPTLIKTESLGLVDSVVAVRTLVKVLTELLGLSDVVVKDVSKVLVDNLGLVDTYDRTWSAYRTYSELLGLADAVAKMPSKTFPEALGLDDRVSKHVSLHALTEILGLLDSISYGKNLTILAKLIRKLIQIESIGGGGQN